MSKTHHDYKITLKQLGSPHDGVEYEVTKTSTARYLLGEIMSRRDAIALCDKHNVIIRNSSGLYMGNHTDVMCRKEIEDAN